MNTQPLRSLRMQQTQRLQPIVGGTKSTGAIYMYTLMILAPIASFLVIPVQGLTPANVLLYMSLLIPFFGIKYQVKFLLSAGLFVLVYLAFLMGSLSGYLFSTPNFTYIDEIRRLYLVGALRVSHITQGLYLFSAIIFFYHCYANYNKRLLDWAYYGIIVLIVYGFYQFAFYAIFGFSGDFIANRSFGGDDVLDAGGGKNWIQLSPLLGSRFIRFYSLTGEASFFSLTATPFFVFAFAMRSMKIAMFILLALFLASSSTAIIGILVAFFVLYCRDSKYVLFGLPAVLILVVVAYFSVEPVRFFLDNLILKKIGTESGNIRTEYFINHMSVVLDGNPLRLFFGLGFGTVRSADMLSTLIANVGVIGFLAYSALILLPTFYLPKDRLRIPLQAVLWSIWAMEMLAVSEYAYLPPWFFVAMAYRHISNSRRDPRSPQNVGSNRTLRKAAA